MIWREWQSPPLPRNHVPVSREAGRCRPASRVDIPAPGAAEDRAGDGIWDLGLRMRPCLDASTLQLPEGRQGQDGCPRGGGGHSNDAQRWWVWMGSRARRVRHCPRLGPSGTPAWPREPLRVLAWVPGGERGLGEGAAGRPRGGGQCVPHSPAPPATAPAPLRGRPALCTFPLTPDSGRERAGDRCARLAAGYFLERVCVVG